MHTKFWSENLKGREYERPTYRWEDNIRTNLGEIRWEGVDWICLAEERDHWQVLVNAVMNWVP
jgi:hypothetical protein